MLGAGAFPEPQDQEVIDLAVRGFRMLSAQLLPLHVTARLEEVEGRAQAPDGAVVFFRCHGVILPRRPRATRTLAYLSPRS